MTELRYNNQGGVLGGALTNVGTTITFAVAPNFATLTGGQTITLVIEPGTANMEIVYLTAYTSGATTGTITRAAEDSSHWPAVAHNTAVVWQATPTVNDFNSLAPLASPTFTGTVTVANGAVLGTPASVTLTNGTGLPESGVTNLTSDLALKAPLASPTFTGTPAAPTAAVGTNTTQLASTAFVQAASYLPITTQAGTTYTLVLADAISEIEFTNAAAVTVTVPTNASVAFPVGTTINIRQMGAGQITVAAAGGVTVDTDSVFTTPEQYSTIGLIKSATNVWVLSGTAAIPASLPPNGAAGGDLAGTYPNPTVPGALKAASNLSDVAQRGTSRFNLRLPVIASCQAAATANVSIAAPGASMDGYSFTTSGTDSFLLTGQNTASENGIWTWNGAASPATRQTDFPHGGSITGGRFVLVQNGTVNIGTLWTLAVASNAPITIDTTAQTWTALNITGTTANEAIVRANSLNQMATATGDYSMGSHNLTSVSTINKVTLTTPATNSVLTIADGKTLTASNTLTLAGTDGQTFTFQNGSGTVATLNGAANNFTTAIGILPSTAGTTALVAETTTPSSADATVATLRSVNAGFRSQVSIQNTGANATNNVASMNFQCNTSSTTRSIFQYDCSFSNVTDGSRTSLVTMNTASAGTFGSCATIAGKNWTFSGSATVTTGFGCNGASAQTAAASGGAAPAGGTGATAGAYDTSAHRDALITLVNNMRTALVNNGIMS